MLVCLVLLCVIERYRGLVGQSGGTRTACVKVISGISVNHQEIKFKSNPQRFIDREASEVPTIFSNYFLKF